MIKRLPLWVLIGWCWQCSTYSDSTAELRLDYYRGDYQPALEKIEKSGLKDSSRDLLLYQLEKAMILDRAGERAKSRQLLLQADKQVEKLYTTSISNTAATVIINESMQDYSGEDYEKVAIHTMLALSFLQDNQLEEAGVEARKINLVLKNITREYDQRYNSYREDALATYLSGIIHEAQGEDDDAIIDYQQALTTLSQPSYHQFYLGSVPEHLVQALYLLAVKHQRSEIAQRLDQDHPEVTQAAKASVQEGKTSQIIVIHEIGHIAVKRAQDFVIPLGNQIVRISFPYIPYNESLSYASTGFDLEGNGFYPARNLAYLDAIAHFALEERRGRLILKSAARLIAKAAMTEQANKNFGPLAGLAANVFSVVTETADTRGWTLLPEAISISRAWVQPGKHPMKIMTNGRLDQTELVEIAPKKMAIFRSY